MFWKKKARSGGETVALPWEGDVDAEITANLAIGNLRNALMQWLTSERGVHAETLMVSIGAIAGFAAQNAAWQRFSNAGRAAPDGAMATAQAGGETYYFGDFINDYLAGDSGYKPALWGFVAPAAVQAGVPANELPDLLEMFRHVSGTIGTSQFGIPRSPDDHPTHLAPRKALELFWPHARFILSRTDGPGPAAGRSVAPEHWPAVCGFVAFQFITMAKDTLDPRLCVRLVMESAIAMSKVDPKSIPQTLPETPAVPA